MDDIISRRAAIDALMAWEEGSVWDEECLKHRGEPYWVAPSDVIEQLPSAQPEVLAHGEGELSAQPEQQWIPCSERLPVEGIVLVTYRDRDIDILRYPTEYRQCDIIAWMPIEPWRGEEHGQDD